MIGRDPTGSKFHRILRCPASAALPQVDDVDPKPGAVRGTVIHRFLQRVSELRAAGADAVDAREKALGEMAGKVSTDVFAYLEILDVEALPTNLAAEVALAYDWDKGTARELGRGIEREYTGLALTEIPMTLDVLGISETHVYVPDYKSGRAALPAPAENGQLLLQGLAASRAFDRDEAIVEIIYLDEDGSPRPASAELGPLELEEFAAATKRAMEDVVTAKAIVARGGMPNVRAGAHCRYCPSFRACPAQTALVRAAMAAPQPIRTGGVFAPGALEPARVADTWRMLGQVKVALGLLEGEILVLAGREPIDLGEGKVLGPVEVAREKVVNADSAHAILEARYSREAADGAMTRKTSKVAIRKTIAKHKPPKAKLSTQRGDGELDLVLDALRNTGGLQTTRSVRVRETTPDRLAPPIATPPGLTASEEGAELDDEDPDDFG